MSHEIFSTHKHVKFLIFVKNGVVLCHQTTLFNNTNAVSKPEQCGQIVHGVFWKTFTKYCEITNNILQIILPKSCKIFLIKRFTLTMDPRPNTNWVT